MLNHSVEGHGVVLFVLNLELSSRWNLSIVMQTAHCHVNDNIESLNS